MEQNNNLDQAIELIRVLDDGKSDFVDPDGDVTEETQKYMTFVAMLHNVPVYKIHEILTDDAQVARINNEIDRKIQYGD